VLARQTLATLNNFAKYGERFRAHVAVLPLAAQALGEVPTPPTRLEPPLFLTTFPQYGLVSLLVVLAFSR
jgi:hypothetical protein